MRSQQTPYVKTKLKKLTCADLITIFKNQNQHFQWDVCHRTVQLRLSIAESARQPKRLKTLVRCQVSCTNRGA